MEYIDSNVPMHCGECDLLIEGIPAMEQHVAESHPEYTPKEVREYVRTWADDAYDQLDLENLW